MDKFFVYIKFRVEVEAETEASAEKLAENIKSAVVKAVPHADFRKGSGGVYPIEA